MFNNQELASSVGDHFCYCCDLQKCVIRGDDFVQKLDSRYSKKSEDY